MKMRSLYALVVMGLLPVGLAGAQVMVSTAGEQQKGLMFKGAPDGGLGPVVGVETVQVFRCTHDDPNGVKVGEGGAKWTYNHHTDMAVWKGKLYLAWTNGEKDEDIWPSHEVFATSEDGSLWSEPKELFPQGVSTSLRSYWFHAPNGRMLVMGGLRTGTEKLEEKEKGGLVVREVKGDGTLGEVYTLQGAPAGKKAMKPVPMYTESTDKGFVEACGQLLGNRPFLEQQDFGVLLGDRKMKVYEGADKDFGRAFCFFERGDGLVAVGKKGWVTLSKDRGETWSVPEVIKGIVTGNAKVWAQKTSDGKYAMLYNPHPSFRLPLVIQTSEDGVTFGRMGVVNGETPLQRYVGVNRTPGVQYMRGVSIFANDGSRKDTDLFVAYSANKEDIWVSRVAVPVRFEETGKVDDRFEETGKSPMWVPNWNTYSPKWAQVGIFGMIPSGRALVLTDADPFDVAQAQRVFKESEGVTIRTELTCDVKKGGELEMEVRGAAGEARPVRLVVGEEGVMKAADGGTMREVGTLKPGEKTAVTVQAGKGVYAVTVNGKKVEGLKYADPAERLSRVIFRTGPMQVIPGRASKTVENDRPLEEASHFYVHSVKVE